MTQQSQLKAGQSLEKITPLRRGGDGLWLAP